MLTIGTIVCALAIPYTGLVFASAAPPPGQKMLSADLDVLSVVLALPAFLAAWRWPRAAAYSMWTLTFFRVLFAVTAGALLPMLIPILALGGVSGLASWIETISARKPSAP